MGSGSRPRFSDHEATQYSTQGRNTSAFRRVRDVVRAGLPVGWSWPIVSVAPDCSGQVPAWGAAPLPSILQSETRALSATIRAVRAMFSNSSSALGRGACFQPIQSAFREPKGEPTATDSQPCRATFSRIPAAQRLTRPRAATPGNGRTVTGGQRVAGSRRIFAQPWDHSGTTAFLIRH